MTTQVDLTATINKYVGSADLAGLFNITERRIQQITYSQNDEDREEKIFEAIGNKKPFTYDIQKSVKAYVQCLQDQLKGKSAKLGNLEKEGSKLDADVELKQIKIKTARLQLAEIEGNMHRSEDVRYMTDDLVLTIRAMLLALPSRLSEDLTDISDSREIHKILKDEIIVILEQLKNHKYDPKAYKERLKERNKRDVNGEDEEDEY